MTNSNAVTVSSEGLKDAVHRWESVTSQINADRPISTLEEDLLQRGAFCFSLASALREWKGEKSLVIGLYGPWGIGKSSVKNIVVSLLEKSDPTVPVIEFNPWSWSGEDRLVSAFFDEIGAALPKVGNGADHAALSRKWNAYATRMTLGGTALGHLKTASEFAGIPWVPMILGTLSNTARSASTLAKQASKAHEAVDDTPAQKLKDQLSAELQKLTTPVLVIMDDVDRLTSEEIRLLFRIVKANADFPNLVFLMLYDRDVVEQSLKGHVGSSGREYMDKIVQAGFDIPRPDQESLDKVLFSHLASIIGSDPARMKFSSDRWQQVYLNGLRPFFTTLRSVRKFLSSFAFHVGLFCKDNQLEVNIIDLIGIEALRVFEPDLHRELAMNPDMVFGDQYLGFGDRNEERENHRKVVEKWCSRAVDNRSKAVRELSRCLFPQIDWLLSNQCHGMGFEPGWLRDLRVCHSQVFDRYFSLLIPEHEVSQAFIDKLLTASISRDRFRELLLGLGSPDKISAALNRFEVYVVKVDFSYATEVIHALFDVGEALPHKKGSPFGASADMYAWRIINELLRKEPNIATRSAVALKCLEETSATWFPCRFVSIEQPREGEHLNPHRDVFDDEAMKGAVACCTNKIRNASRINAIVGERLSFYLWRWKDWAGEGEPKEWTTRYVQEPENALAFIVSMTHEVHASNGRVSRTYMELDMKNIDAFVDADVLKGILSPYFAETVAPEHQAQVDKHSEIIKAAKNAFAKRAHLEKTVQETETDGEDNKHSFRSE